MVHPNTWYSTFSIIVLEWREDLEFLPFKQTPKNPSNQCRWTRQVFDAVWWKWMNDKFGECKQTLSPAVSQILRQSSIHVCIPYYTLWGSEMKSFKRRTKLKVVKGVKISEMSIFLCIYDKKMWNHRNNSMKKLKPLNLLFLQGEVSSDWSSLMK